MPQSITLSGVYEHPRFYGIVAPLVTLFKEDPSLDTEVARWLVKYLVKKGVHGVFLNSTTGELVHLKREEAVELTKSAGSSWWKGVGYSRYRHKC